MEKANIIIQQMGGFGKLKAMVNGRNFIALENGVTFNFSGNRKYTFCEVKLNGNDLYDLIIGKFINGKVINEVVENNLYADMLKPRFENITGLYLSL